MTEVKEKEASHLLGQGGTWVSAVLWLPHSYTAKQMFQPVCLLPLNVLESG